MHGNCLAVLDEANVVGQLPESLALHVQAVLADQTASTLVAGHAAAATALAVLLGATVPDSCEAKTWREISASVPRRPQGQSLSSRRSTLTLVRHIVVDEKTR